MKSRSQIFCGMAMFAAFLAPAIYARVPVAPIIKEIDVECEGLPLVDKEKIVASMRTKIGDTYSEEAIDADIRSFYNIQGMGFRIFGVPVRDGVKIVVVIHPPAPRDEVSFQPGAGDKLAAVVGIEQGAVNLREFRPRGSFVDLGVGQPDIMYASGMRLKMEIRIPGRIRL